MAGRPKLHADIALLRSEAETVEDMLAAGKSQKDVRDAMGVSRSAWDRYLGSEQGAASLARARQAAAAGLAESTMDIVDGVEEDRDAIAKAKLRVDNRRWLAGVWDSTYADRKGTEVNVNINTLHLQAARAVSAELGAQQAALPEAEEAEWLEVDDDEEGDDWLDL